MTNSAKEKLVQGFVFPPEYAVCIAEVISSWSALESNIDLSIWHLAGVYPAIGACITTQIFTLDGRLKALLALLQVRKADDKIVRRLNKFSESVRKAQQIRNRITHDTWHQSRGDKKEMSQIEIGAKGVLIYGYKKISIEALREDSEVVIKAMYEAAGIRDAIEDGLPTLPEISLGELHPIVRHSDTRKQTRASDKTFLLFPPRPSQA